MIPTARLDIMRYLFARVHERYGCRLLRLIVDEETTDTMTRIEFVTSGKVIPFTIDDVDWNDPHALTDFVLSNIEKIVNS